MGRKIRDAELAKAPYMLVVGDREQDAEYRRRCAITARVTSGALAVDELIERLRTESGSLKSCPPHCLYTRRPMPGTNTTQRR